jgi:hypothetical protein
MEHNWESIAADSNEVAFNGGKMNHIFTPGKGVYEQTFSCDAAQRCFEDPSSVATLKVHGECCLLTRQPKSETDDFEWIFCTRHDSKAKPPPEDAIAVPPGVHPAKYGKHAYCFLPLDRNKVMGKGMKNTKVGPDTYAAIAAGVANGDLPDPNGPNCPNHIAVEWVGRKHQGNVDNLDVDHGLYIHGSTIVDIPERSREAIERMAHNVSIEGVVFYDRVTGERFKLRLDMFEGSMFTKNCKQPVTPESTTIKPKVIVTEATNE